MICEDVQLAIVADGLNSEQTAHIANCSECQAFASDLDVLASLPPYTVHTNPQQIHKRVQDLRPQFVSTHYTIWKPYVLAAAAILICLGSTWMWHSQPLSTTRSEAISLAPRTPTHMRRHAETIHYHSRERQVLRRSTALSRRIRLHHYNNPDL